MERPHRIKLVGNSLTIDEMYFRIDEIRFVDVVKQSYPLLRQLLILSAVCCAIIALLFHETFPDVTLFFAGCAVLEIVAVCLIKRRYALRIGQQFGTTKVIISTDSKALEEIRREIAEILSRDTASRTALNSPHSTGNTGFMAGPETETSRQTQ